MVRSAAASQKRVFGLNPPAGGLNVLRMLS